MTQTATVPAISARQAEHRLITFDHNQIDWHVADEYEWLVRDPDAPNWSRLASCPTAELIKRNEVREVWRVTLRGQLFYAKIYYSSGPVGRLKNWIRGPACVLEWRTGWYAHRHGIRAIRPVARGLSSAPGDPVSGVLVTPALVGAIPLDEYWANLATDRRDRLPIRKIRALTDRLAEAVARAHLWRFEHFDLHVGNLLVCEIEGGPPTVTFVDLHSVRINHPVRGRAVVRNLAQLNQWFMRNASRPTRLRFLRRYLEWRGRLADPLRRTPRFDPDLRKVLPLMDRAARGHSSRLWAKRDRRTRRSNKYFSRLRLSYGWRGHVFLQAKHALSGSRASSLRFSVDEWEQWLANPGRWLAGQSRGRVIKSSPSGLVIRSSLPTEDQALEVIVKTHRPQGRLKRMLSGIRRSRDMYCWRAGYALLNRDVATARPLAVLEKRSFGVLRESMLICEAIEGARDLDRFALDVLPAMDQRDARRVKDGVIEALVRLFKRLESRGFTHRDCKASNILVLPASDEAEVPEVWLVDLNGLRSVRRRADFRLWPLVRLSVSLEVSPHVTRTDRLRFLKRTMLGPGRTDRDWKPLWRELARGSDQKRRVKRLRDEWKLTQ